MQGLDSGNTNLILKPKMQNQKKKTETTSEKEKKHTTAEKKEADAKYKQSGVER